MLLIGVLTAALAGAPHADRGNSSGAVAIEAARRAISVYVDTNHDGSVDERFQLSFECPGPATVAPRYFDSASIEFAPGSMRVIAHGEVFEFVVEGIQSADWSRGNARVSRWTGYGLSHNTWESGIAIDLKERDRPITQEWCELTADCDPD